MKRRRAIVTLVLALAAAASVALALRAAWPRFARERALRCAIDDVRRDRDEGATYAACRALAEFEDPRAIVALAEKTAAWNGYFAQRPLRHSVELFATTPEPRDPRPREALEGIARDAKIGAATRFNAFMALEELEHPTYGQEPIELASRERVRIDLDATPPGATLDAIGIPVDLKALDEGGMSTGERGKIEDRPWRALVQIAQTFDGTHVLLAENGRYRFARERTDDGIPIYPRRLHAQAEGDRYVVLDGRGNFGSGKRELREVGPPRLEIWLAVEAGKTLVITPPAKIEALPSSIEFANPLRALRALAALNGCAVRERDAKIIELYRP